MRKTSGLLGFVVVCALVAGCGGSSLGAKGAKVKFAKNGTFTMAMSDDRGNFDPYHTNNINYAKFAYDSLVNLRPDGTWATGLAEKWKVDVNSATFTLRGNVTCSDGTPLTAGQVAADLKYLGNPKNKAFLYGVTVPSIPFKVTSDDASRTVKIDMSEPFGFLLNTIGQTPIVCEKGLRDQKILQRSSSGTGPFVLTNVAPGQSYTFTVRKDYKWGPDGASTSAPGTPAKVVFQVMHNETTAANLLLSGEVNLARINGEDRNRLDARGLRRFDRPSTGVWLHYNVSAGRVAADQRIRQALVAALDLDEIVKVNSGGTGHRATGLMTIEPKVCKGDTLNGLLPKHDVAAAESLLDQAGWTKGADGIRRKGGKPLKLDMVYVTEISEYNAPTAELVRKRFADIGVQAKLIPTTLAVSFKYLFETRNWDIWLQGNGINLPSQAVPAYSGPPPPEGQNWTGINNPEYSRLAAKAKALPLPESCTYWNQAEQALFRDVDVVPIVTRPEPWYLNKAQATYAGYDRPLPSSIRMLQ